MKNVLILGGDGYLGWPTAMFFSSKGYKVALVDNYLRRKICRNLNITLLYDVPNLLDRVKIWYELTGFEIKVAIGDMRDAEFVRSLFNGKIKYDWIKSFNRIKIEVPDIVIHFAEMPSAPYSMMNYDTSNFTISNNLLSTNNLMYAIKDYSKETHIIKIGTMGEYGTPDIDIEEGWIEIEHKGRKDKFIYPRQANSIYHTTKIMDTDLLWFGVRMWNLKVTDLMQGPVYGIETEESRINEKLSTLFNYDEVFGTVINRFIIQAVYGYPLTVYGAGGQTRGYINIKDVLQCIYVSSLNPPNAGELRIFNQFTETFTVKEIAEKVSSVANKLGYNCTIKSINNPRIELEHHYYNVIHKGLLELGIKPNYLTSEIIHDIFKIVEKYKNNIREDLIFSGIKW